MTEIMDIGDFIKKYFCEYHDDLEVIHIDKEKIVVRDTFSSIKLAVPFIDEIDVLIEKFDSQYADEDTLRNFEDSFENIVDINRISEYNSKLAIFQDKGYKFGDTIELLFKYSVTDYENTGDAHLIHCETFDMWEFNIGKVNIKIDNPSSIFQFIFKDYESDDCFVGWNVYNTALIKGIDANNCQDIFQQVMFWIYQMCPSVYTVDFPEVTELCYEWEEVDAEVDESSKGKEVFCEEYKNMEFDISKHPEPIYFYNAAKRINDNDIAFLYFYKILEYFFIISRKENIKNRISEYNSNHDIDALIAGMHDDYFGKKEALLLRGLIDSIDSALLDDIRNLAFTNSLISQDDNDTLSNELYLHRNSIVHGKFEFKRMKLRMPNRIDDLKGRKWTELIEKLTFSLIAKYCYNK